MAWACVAPFFVLFSLSSGLMPVRTDGGVVMVICSGDGPVQMRLDPETGHPVPDDHDGDGQGTCHWAGLHASAALSPGQAEAIHAERACLVPAVAIPFILAAARVTGLPPSTGPPLLARVS